MKRFAIIAALLWTVPLATPKPARAVELAPSFYAGMLGGGMIVLQRWGLSGVDLPTNTAGSGPSANLRFGGQILEWLGFEATGALIPHQSTRGDTNWAAEASFDVVFFGTFAEVRPFGHPWLPVAHVGAGVLSNVTGDLGRDTDFQVHFGLGYRAMLTEVVGLRLDVRDYFTDGAGSDSFGNLFSATLGVEVVLISPDSADDVDGRGTLVGSDAPASAAPAVGALDGDGDGVVDASDGCPKERGSVRAGGCPDADDDGVADREDNCPRQPGIRTEQGCPPVEEQKLPFVPASILPFVMYFETGQNTFSPAALKTLDSLVKYLATHPKVTLLEIHGHADDRSTSSFNLKLSKKRAMVVYEELLQRGVAKERLVVHPYGEFQPAWWTTDEESRRKNRRVQFAVLKRTSAE